MGDHDQTRVFGGLPEAGGPAQGAKKDDVLPDALKGKTPEEIYAALKAEHIREMSEQTEDYAQKLERLAQTGGGGGAQPASPQQPAQPGGQFPFTPPNAEPGLDLANPEEYLNRQVDRRIQPIVESMVASGREAGRSLIQQKIPKEHWERFSKEIESFVDQTTPQVQANTKVYEIAYNWVKGQHADELIEERATSKTKEAVVEVLKEMGIDTEKIPAHTLGGSKPQEPARQTSLFQGRTGVPQTAMPRSGSAATSTATKGRLSDVEKLMCQKFEMSEEEYMFYKAQNSDIVSELRGER